MFVKTSSPHLFCKLSLPHSVWWFCSFSSCTTWNRPLWVFAFFSFRLQIIVIINLGFYVKSYLRLTSKQCFNNSSVYLFSLFWSRFYFYINSSRNLPVLFLHAHDSLCRLIVSKEVFIFIISFSLPFAIVAFIFTSSMLYCRLHIMQSSPGLPLCVDLRCTCISCFLIYFKCKG